MTRSFLSIGLALIILVVVIGGPCVACQPGSSPMKGGDCCKNHGKCPRTDQKTRVACGTPALDAFTIEKISTVDGQVLFSAAPVLAAFAPVATVVPVTDTGVYYSPPDLRILNSSLTI